MEERIANHEDFAIETTLSGSGYARMIPEWQSRGYTVELVFLQLPNVEMAISRVSQRVTQGGHNIPETTVLRRFHSGWYNFENIYKAIVDKWALYDGSKTPPELISWR